jgi:hypothetical protein
MRKTVLRLLAVVWLLVANIETRGEPAGWWKFDEGSGTVAGDSSGFGYDGTLNNMDANSWCEGLLGKALYFDGVDDYVSVPPFALAGTNTFTITAWIKCKGAQGVYTGIVWSRDKSSGAGTGICFGSTGEPYFEVNQELAYCWGEEYWRWHSGLIVPTDEWVFVAMVVEANRATLYLGRDGTLSSATNEVEHRVIEKFDGVSMIGYDRYEPPNSNYLIRHHAPFKGMIDDVRVYDHSLDGDKISAIYTAAKKSG